MTIALPDQLDPRLLRACEFALRHPATKLSVKQLAAVSFLSPFHFLRRFKKELGETPHHFVTRIRIERAKELLSDQKASVTEICFQVGFESMSSFSLLFHKAVGWSPSVYRSRVWALRSHPAKFIPDCYVRQFGLVTVSNSR